MKNMTQEVTDSRTEAAQVSDLLIEICSQSVAGSLDDRIGKPNRNGFKALHAVLLGNTDVRADSDRN